MCGIVGIVSYSRSPDLPTAVAMAESIRHRGPDDAGYELIDGIAAIGMRRLSIIDLEGGHQPMWDERNRLCLVFNGEIYNHAHLRERLSALGHVFTTDHSDTEVLVHGYEQWGRDLFPLLNGMFAVLIWDRDRTELVLARDRSGEKPLYVAELSDGWAVGSELKALLAHPGIQPEVDPVALEQYLAFDYTVGPRTILRHVQKIRAGHVATITRAGLESEPYWSLRFSRRRIRLGDALEKLDYLLDQSVRLRMLADVPVGLFLSGGLDSTTVGYYMRQHSANVSAFTIGFEERGFDETEHAALAARHLGLDHHVEVLSERRVLDLLPRVTDLLDEPMADPSVVPTYLLSTFTRSHVKVALGGDGSDEYLMGYRTYQALKVSSWLDWLPRPVRGAVAESARRLPDRSGTLLGKGRRFLAGVDVSSDARLIARLGSFGLDARRYLAESYQADIEFPVEAEVLAEIERSHSGAQDWADRAVAGYHRAYLGEDILVKVDRASMAASLEARAPFLDPELVEFLSTLPPSLKLRGFTSKYLLRRLMRGRVPDQVIDRRKQGFGAPMDAWFRGPLAQLAMQELEPDRLRCAGLVDPDQVMALLRAHLSGRADHGTRLWSLVQLHLWHDRWVSSPVRS